MYRHENYCVPVVCLHIFLCQRLATNLADWADFPFHAPRVALELLTLSLDAWGIPWTVCAYAGHWPFLALPPGVFVLSQLCALCRLGLRWSPYAKPPVFSCLLPCMLVSASLCLQLLVAISSLPVNYLMRRSMPLIGGMMAPVLCASICACSVTFGFTFHGSTSSRLDVIGTTSAYASVALR